VVGRTTPRVPIGSRSRGGGGSRAAAVTVVPGAANAVAAVLVRASRSGGFGGRAGILGCVRRGVLGLEAGDPVGERDQVEQVEVGGDAEDVNRALGAGR